MVEKKRKMEEKNVENQEDKEEKRTKSRQVSKNLQDNIEVFETIFSDCKDVMRREMELGKDGKVKCFLAYIEVTLSEEGFIGKMLHVMQDMTEAEIYENLSVNGMGIADVKQFDNFEDVQMGILVGDSILFIDGFDKALKFPCKGYPGRSVSTADTEKVFRGSMEAFSESVKLNSALIRKRLRTPGVKLKDMQMGVRSKTLINIMYMDDLVEKERIETLEKELEKYEIDGVLDSGILEQLVEKKWYSPFPQFQTTERPDKAAKAILDGRIVLMSDNSPMALLLPADINSFFIAEDDYYSRFEIASLMRFLRYLGAILAVTLPGLYLAVSTFHTQVLPTGLVLSFAAARQGIPFSPLVELLFMEIAFELLREAGVRLPGVSSNAIGIVGGLIIGQTAVEARLVSTIVVVVVALTALASFTIPNQELVNAFRLVKFFLIFCGGIMGFYGVFLGILVVFIHLAHLKSFGIPYLMPFIGADLNGYVDERDSIIRWPLRFLNKRPVYAKEASRVRLKKKGK